LISSGINTPAAGEANDPNDRTFDDFASRHSFDVFEPPKQVADLGFKLEHLMLAVVPRAPSRTIWLIRLSRHNGAFLCMRKAVACANSFSSSWEDFKLAWRSRCLLIGRAAFSQFPRNSFAIAFFSSASHRTKTDAHWSSHRTPFQEPCSSRYMFLNAAIEPWCQCSILRKTASIPSVTGRKPKPVSVM